MRFNQVLDRALIGVIVTAVMACVARGEEYIPIVNIESSRHQFEADEPVRIDIRTRPPERTTHQPLYFGRLGMFGWGEFSRLRIIGPRGCSPPPRGWGGGDLDHYEIGRYGDLTTRFDLSEAGSYRLVVRIRDGAEKRPSVSKPLTFVVEHPSEGLEDASKVLADLPIPPVKSQRETLKSQRKSKEPAKLRVALTESRTRFRVGELIRCRAEVENLSQNEVFVANPCPPLGAVLLNTALVEVDREDFRFMNDWGHMQAERQDWYPEVLKLAPGEVVRTEFVLNDFYDLTVAGEYLLVGFVEKPVPFEVIEP